MTHGLVGITWALQVISSMQPAAQAYASCLTRSLSTAHVMQSGTGYDRIILSYWNKACWNSTGKHLFRILILHYLSSGSRDSDSLRVGRPKSRSSSPGRFKNFLFFMSSRPPLGSTQPPIKWVPGSLPPRVKRPGRSANHSPPASAEVKKVWIYTSTPPTPSCRSA
jgi:hypothetical protein